MSKRLTERALGVLLALCMVFICLPENLSFKAGAVQYGLYVGTKMVTSDNASDIMGDGNVRYDSTSKTLYIKGIVNLSVHSKSGYWYADDIVNQTISGLTICVEDDCTLIGNIKCSENTTITGSAPLKIVNQTPDGKEMKNETGGNIYVTNDFAKLTIKDADVSLAESIYGGNMNTSLKIIHSDMVVVKEVRSFNSGITLSDCYIKSPSSAVIESSKVIKGSDDPLVIAAGEDTDPSYGIKIGTTAIRPSNASDVLGNGVFSFNASTKTLTVKGNSSNSTIYNNSCKDLIIKPVVNSSVKGLNLNANTTISGSEKLTVSDPIYAYCVLTVKNANIITRSIYGDKTSAVLRFENSTAEITGYVQDFAGGIFLTGCYISSPETATVKSDSIDKGGYATIRIIPGDKPVYVEYGIRVGVNEVGLVDVTSLNASDIRKDGNFSYDAATKTLTVKGSDPMVTIANDSCNGLTIKTTGNYTVRTLKLNADTTLIGSYTLSASGINTEAALTIKNASVSATNIYGDDKYASLNIIDSKVSVEQSVSKFANGITLSDCYIKSPLKSYIHNGSIVKSDTGVPLVIVPGTDPNPPYIYYGIIVDGVKVDNENYADILGDGLYSYDPVENILLITANQQKSISCNAPGLTVSYGDPDADMGRLNTGGLTVYADTRVIGKAYLYSSISVYKGAKLTLDNADINCIENVTGYDGGEILELINTKFTVNSASNVTGFTGGIQLTHTDLVSPEGAVIENGSVMLDGSPAQKVMFDKSVDHYGIFFGGREITSKNCDDVFSDSAFLSGDVSYSPEKNTLYLSEYAAAHICKEPSIRNEGCPGLKITSMPGVEQQVRFCGEIIINADTYFCSPEGGELDFMIERYTSDQNAITVGNGASLTLNEVTLTAEGAIVGSDTGERLIIDYSNVYCSNNYPDKTAVYGFDNGIKLYECHVTAPEGANVSGSEILDKEGKPVPEGLEIRKINKYPLYIDYIQVTDDNIDDIENLFMGSSDAMSKTAEGTEFVSYDGETLTLKDVDLENIELEIGDGTLNIEGDVKFSTHIDFTGEMTLTGSGTLTAGTESALLFVKGAQLSIRETKVNSTILGDSTLPETSLEIFASDVTAPKGIYNLSNSVSLKECTIEAPENAVIGKSIFASNGSDIAKNVVITGKHVHTEKLTLVEAVNETCETDGNIAYYECTCGRKFKEKTAKTELTDEQIIIPATGHDMEFVEKVPATCEEDGTKAYYKCNNCGGLYWDELATSPVTDPDDLMIHKTGHNYGAASYKWSPDHTKVTATCICTRDPSHIITETVDTTFTDTELERTYTAEFTDAHFTTQTMIVDISPVMIMLGDLDKDGVVDIKDATLLMRYVNGWTGLTLDLSAADLDRDGEITLRDAVILMRYAKAWDGYDTYIIEVEA